MADPTRTRTAAPDDGITRTSAGEPPTVAPGESELGTETRDAVRALDGLRDDLGSPTPAAAVEAPPGFALDREIGSGGMGVVYLAHQSGLNRPVALKTVRAGTTLDHRSLIRFLAEAEAVAAVRHPNVVEVYSFGEHAGRPFLALEYCPGGDLTTVTKAEQTRDANWFRRVAELMAKIAAGVNAAHALGIVHRDLKPANVLLAADGSPKVTDFGLAKRGLGTDLTHTTDVLGTPAYMAPEQASGRTKFVGPEADVWALGVMLYELASGTRPFDAPNSLEILAAVAKAEVPPLRDRFPAVPVDLALVAHKCLSVDPRDRYPTAGGLAADLRNWLDGKPVSARPAGVIEGTVKWVKRNRRVALTGLAVLLVMATATGVSVGFGLEAEKQASVARSKQIDLENAATALDAERQELTKEVGRTQRALAKAILAPFYASGSSSFLTEYEQTSLWELVDSRNGPVPQLVIERGTENELTAAQFQAQAVYLDHAAVGLNSRHRREVDAILSKRLNEGAPQSTFKVDIALAAVGAERFGSTETIADILASALVTSLREENWDDLALADGLVAACAVLPSDRAAELCRKVVKSFATAFSGRRLGDSRRRLAVAFAALCQYLPMNQAAEESYKVATVLIAQMRKEVASGGRVRMEFCYGLAAVSARLSPDHAAELCGQAIKLLRSDLASTPMKDRTPHCYAWAELCERLPTDSALQLLTEALANKADFSERQPLFQGLGAICRRIPDKQAVDFLTRAIQQPIQAEELGQLAEILAAVCGGMSPDQAVHLCSEPTQVLLRAFSNARGATALSGLAVGLGALCKRLPADRAGEVCHKIAEHLASVQWIEDDKEDERVRCLVAVSRYLPANQAADVGALVQTVYSAQFIARTRWMDNYYLNREFIYLCSHLPQSLSTKLLSDALLHEHSAEVWANLSLN